MAILQQNAAGEPSAWHMAADTPSQTDSTGKEAQPVIRICSCSAQPVRNQLAVCICMIAGG